MEEINGLSDKEILRLIYKQVSESKEELDTIKKDLEEIRIDQKTTNLTIYGDVSKGIKGLLHDVRETKEFTGEIKKWKFTAGAIVGFAVAAFGLVTGVYQLFSMFHGKN